MKKSLNKTIGSFLIITTLVVSFNGITTKKVYAEDSISSYINSLSPVITKMPGCKKALGGSGISELFKSVKDLFSSKSSKLESKAKDLAEKKTNNNSVDVYDSATRASVEEVKKIVKEAVKKSGAASVKDMGKVMGMITPQLKGKADMSLVSKIVKESLS